MAYNPNPGMSITGGNRNVKNLPMKDGKRQWSHGLFDCFDDFGTCVVAWFFPCVTYGQIKHRYDHLTNKGFPDPNGNGIFSSDCMIHCCVTSCGCGWAMQMGTRGSIRQRYDINGGGCGDCCTALWCTPCELTQESRELELEENSCVRPAEFKQ